MKYRNWVLANPHVSSVIAGPRTEAQWVTYLAAIEEEFDAEDEAVLERLAGAAA
jgi:aryl-alcohol dehydrogenase-like predicted oxidoreductase